MFDITDLQKSASLVFSNIVLLFTLYLLLKPSFEGNSISKSRATIAILIAFVFCLFSFWAGDWFHYFELFPTLKYYGITHMEDIYVAIAQVSPNYLVFRVIVWGSALFLACDSFKRVGCNYNLALFIFCVAWLIWFSYARVSLAMAMMFWGVSIIYKPLLNGKKISIIIGFAAIFASFYFHKSAAFGIGIIAIAFIANRFKGRTILILSILMVPIIFALVQQFLLEYMLADVDAEEGALEASIASGQRYMAAEVYSKGIAAKIARVFERAPYYLTAYCCLKFSGKKDIFEAAPASIQTFVYIAFYLVLFSTIFAFDIGFSTAILYSRFMRFAAIPCVIVLAYCYEINETHKVSKYAIYAGLIGTSIQLLYSLYLA